jgi:hypothetical protein
MAENETLASLLRGRNRAGQPVDATANIIGPAMSALGNTIYGAGRGALTAMAGLPGDINQLITDNLGTLVNAQGLPTTKEIQDFLPAKPTSYEGKLAQKLGEFIPVNPTPIAKGAVAIAKPVGKAMGEQAYRMTEDMLQKQGMMPSIVAYHGTPHNIEGAFDISKVGTGEGAQAYGHGMYYAENPNVATAYKNILSKPEFTKTAEGVELRGQLPRMLEESYSELIAKNGIQQTNYGDVTDIVGQRLDRQMKDALKANDMDWYNKTADMKIDLARFKENPPPNVGNLYKVDIPDEYVPTLMDYDKPLGQQSALVKKALNNIKKQITPEMKMELGGDMNLLFGKDVTPVQFLNTMEIIHPDGRGIGEKLLNEAGVKGLRYLDATSRTEGKGTSNFVVFDPKEVKILEKNSKPVSRKEILEQAFEGSMPHYKDYENLASVFEKAGLKIKETGSSKSGSKYVEINDPVSGEMLTVRFADHPQTGSAISLHGNADIEIGEPFKNKSWKDAINPILDRINKSRKQYGDELLTINQN